MKKWQREKCVSPFPPFSRCIHALATLLKFSIWHQNHSLKVAFTFLLHPPSFFKNDVTDDQNSVFVLPLYFETPTVDETRHSFSRCCKFITSCQRPSRGVNNKSIVPIPLPLFCGCSASQTKSCSNQTHENHNSQTFLSWWNSSPRLFVNTRIPTLEVNFHFSFFSPPTLFLFKSDPHPNTTTDLFKDFSSSPFSPIFEREEDVDLKTRIVWRAPLLTPFYLCIYFSLRSIPIQGLTARKKNHHRFLLCTFPNISARLFWGRTCTKKNIVQQRTRKWSQRTPPKQ